MPSIEELMPLVPVFPEKGAIIFFDCNFAITLPFLTLVPIFIGSSNSVFLILKETVLLLIAVQ